MVISVPENYMKGVARLQIELSEGQIDESNSFIIYGTFYYAVNNQTEIINIQDC